MVSPRGSALPSSYVGYRFVAGTSETRVYPRHVPLLSDIAIAGRPVNTALLMGMLAFLLAWIVVYMLYKMFWHADFGLPVRRRVLVRRMRIERDQVAYVPMWWSDLQIQRAVSAHWKKSLRSTVGAGPSRSSEEQPAF